MPKVPKRSLHHVAPIFVILLAGIAAAALFTAPYIGTAAGQFRFTSSAQPLPDLVVSDVSYVRTDDIVRLTATIANIGTANAGSSMVRFWDSTNGKEIGVSVVPGMPPGGSATVSMDYVPTTPSFVVQTTVNWGRLLREHDIANNDATVAVR